MFVILSPSLRSMINSAKDINVVGVMSTHRFIICRQRLDSSLHSVFPKGRLTVRSE